MSENLDLVRSIYAAWERGDFSSSDWADPEIEYSWVGGPAPRAWTGRKGMAEANQDYLSAWHDARLEATQYRELDDQRVFVEFVLHGRGKVSGLDVARIPLQTAHLFEVRNGRVCKLVVYWDRGRALVDLGLED